MITYSGKYVDESEGVPSSHDVAMALGRIPRLCGHSRVWWSYLHYAFALMEIALRENKDHYDLEEDDVAAQALIRPAHSSISALWKPAQDSVDEIQARIHEEWDVPYPHLDSEMRELIDRSAAITFQCEVHLWAPEAMKHLPIFEDAPDRENQRVLNKIWDRRTDPDSTAGHMCESVEAYYKFFEERDVGKARHRFGYRTPWLYNGEAEDSHAPMCGRRW